MDQASVSPLAGWVNFYVIIGSSAGALTGLQFVVITLIRESQHAATMQNLRAFGTPTVVHFCAALFVSAIMSAPWQSLSNLDFSIAILGTSGLAYALRVLWHAKKAPYNPDAEDWIWYGVLPLMAYVILTSAAILLRWHPTLCLFVIAGATMLLLSIGIHNAWDTVTFMAIQYRKTAEEKQGNDQT